MSFIIPGHGASTAATTALSQQLRLDKTTSPGNWLIGKAAIGALETAPVWRVGLWTGEALTYGLNLIPWTDRASIIPVPPSTFFYPNGSYIVGDYIPGTFAAQREI